jgi:acetylornithine deacetylase/succinyl-diaminopimelate desuccinylase-like protein
LLPDTQRIQDEVVRHLQALIRFDTTNPPGNELPVAQYLISALAAEGIEAQLLLAGPTRAQVVATLKGNGQGRPVMMMAHMDVVGVERDKWSCDPFSGIVLDGYVYGRGAIDDKGMLAVNLVAMLELKRNVVDKGIALPRDVIFLATADEEIGGEYGMRWMVENHRDLIDAEFAINEGGRIRILPNGKRYLAIQTSEKISHLVTVTARGAAGHSSIPLADNAIFRLGRALAKLGEYREPVTLTETTRRFFAALATIWPSEAEAEGMACLVSDDPEECARGTGVLSKIPSLNAVMRNGISPTMVAGGLAGNVIPAEANAVLNVRTIPGFAIDDVVERMRAAIDDPEIELTITHRGSEAPASDPGSAMFNAMAEAASLLDPDLIVVPYLSTGGTDSSHLRRIGINCYGVLPFPMEQIDETRMHGHDERVPVESLAFGARFIYEAVRRLMTEG